MHPTPNDWPTLAEFQDWRRVCLEWEACLSTRQMSIIDSSYEDALQSGDFPAVYARLTNYYRWM
jgi:hypothetical protein